MDVEYKGQHSIIFFKDTGKGYSKRNSWIDFHMIPATRPYVALGSPNIAQVAIPGTSKRVDITDYRPGGLTFGGRTGTWEFYIDHNKWSEWDSAYNTIKYYIHGNSFLINLTDDPYILYQGILNISGYVAGQNYSKITIQYDLMNETITLDEPIDFGDFGRLPDPKLIDSDGDGILDSLDLDGDGEKDVDLVKSIGYDTDCDGQSDVWVPLDPAKRPKRKLIYGKGSGIIEGLDVNGDYESDFYAFTDPTGKYGFDFDCDGFVEEELVGTDYVDPHDLNIKEDMLPSGTKPKDEWQWIVGDNNEIIGLDVTGDNKVDFIIKEKDGEWTLIPVVHASDLISNVDPKDINVPDNMLPSDVRPKDEWKWIFGENGEIIGLDVTGDNKVDFIIEIKDGKFALVPVIQIPDDPSSVNPSDVHIPPGALPDNALPPEQWTWKQPEEEGKDPCLEVTGDDVCDFVPKTLADGTKVLVPVGEVPEINVPIDLEGYVPADDGDGNKILVPVDEPPATEDPLPEPPKLPDPEEYDIPQKEDYGYDTDCDGVVDIAINQLNPIPPVYIYDEDTGYLIGADCNFDGKVDIYATTDENGNQGIDFTCDGKWDSPVYTPPDKRNDEDKNIPEPGQEDPEGDGGDPTSVIGAYYPLLFIQSDGTESNMYGFSTVSKSNKILGVYDLYTIYQSDKVTPETLGIG